MTSVTDYIKNLLWIWPADTQGFRHLENMTEKEKARVLVIVQGLVFTNQLNKLN